MIDLAYVSDLYRVYARDLAAVGRQQRKFAGTSSGKVVPQLDDIEAEITYLLLRATKPTAVVEIGSAHGWSSSWILSALRDNGSGRLHSFDVTDRALSIVPDELAATRWTFVRGDIKNTVHQVPADTGFLFVDGEHSAAFARWYVDNLFSRLPPDCPVGVHDVFHHRATLPLHEGRVVVRWLDERGVSFFTPSRAKARRAFDTLNSLRVGLGLLPIHGEGDNPMIFFVLP